MILFCDERPPNVRHGVLRWVRTRIILFVLFELALSACKSAPVPADFQVGMSQREIVAAFGEPQHRQSLVKRDPFIMGPIETFWASVPPGAQVEIWSYPVAGGAVELYFVDGSSEVRGKGFAAEGAVY